MGIRKRRVNYTQRFSNAFHTTGILFLVIIKYYLLTTNTFLIFINALTLY